MGRLREFDADDIEAKAMEFFWLNGYQAVAVDDLVKHLGISRSSLYSAWKGKEALFRAAFRRYLRTVGMEAFRPLFRQEYRKAGADGMNDAREAIEQVFATVAHQVAHDPYRRGCMMVNTITELSSVHPDLAQIAHDAKEQMWTMFRSALQPFVDGGKRSATQADGDANLLLALFMGLRVLARGGISPEHAEAVVTMALKPIFGE